MHVCAHADVGAMCRDDCGNNYKVSSTQSAAVPGDIFIAQAARLFPGG